MTNSDTTYGIHNKKSGIFNQSSDGSSLRQAFSNVNEAKAFFFTTEALSGVQKVTSSEFRAQIGEFGVDHLPFIGGWFGADNREQSDFARTMSNCEPGDGECFMRALGTLSTSSNL